jgi:UDP-N-acetylglucosamine--N-acetylmuramyl-(pentapeptide) pyrophosphoryl-undecaprenol N-acetylglucosamine transferase
VNHRVVVAAGASGGHVYPGLAVAEVLRERGHDVEFVGGDRLEARVVPAAGFPFHALPVRRPPSIRTELLTPRGIMALASIARATLKARRLLGRLRPDVVLGMGGFAAVPVALAAPRDRLVLHEQNAHLSAAQRIAVRRARVLALGLPIAERLPDVRTVLVGQPVRRRIAALATLDASARGAARASARERLGLDAAAPTVVVLGGSLGSGPLNSLVPRAKLPAGTQVLHLSGAGNEDAVREAWRSAGVHATVVGFLDSMEDAYASVDVAVSRSGASAVAELSIAALPSVLVPLPTLRRGDQEANARLLEAAGGAVVVLQSDPAFVETVGNEITRLLSDEVARLAMTRAAASFARPDASERLADVIESLVT